MIVNDAIYSVARFVLQTKARIASIARNTVKVSLNTRTRDVGKLDKVKVAKRSRNTQEMSDDVLLKSSLRKAKRKERQAGRKEIRKELKNENS